MCLSYHQSKRQNELVYLLLVVGELSCYLGCVYGQAKDLGGVEYVKAGGAVMSKYRMGSLPTVTGGDTHRLWGRSISDRFGSQAKTGVAIGRVG